MRASLVHGSGRYGRTCECKQMQDKTRQAEEWPGERVANGQTAERDSVASRAHSHTLILLSHPHTCAAAA
jgi:hypothetical protein